MKNKTQKIIIALILASTTLFANFASAQTSSAVCLGAPPPALTVSGVDPNSSTAACAAAGGTWQAAGSTFNVVLKRADDDAAQASQAACMGASTSDSNSYSYKIVNMTQGNYKAVWNASQAPYTGGQDGKLPCRIVTGTWGFQTTDAQNIQSVIRFSTSGLASGTYITAAANGATNQANDAAGGSFIGTIINMILYPINAFLAAFTAFAGGLFANVLYYTLGVSSMPTIVNIGWGIVRDICNMFFILILIVIGLAAILRIESYDYKHLLGEVILMALLVNFSKLIAVTIFNFVNVITAMFAFQGGWVGLKQVFSFALSYVGSDIFNTTVSGSWQAALVLSVTKMLFSLVTLATFLALAALFVVRLVGIYVLVILSPIAYVLDILPATKHFAHEWWQTFVKYLIWAPVALFFVRLAVNLAQSPIPQISDTAFKYVILMALMWAAVLVAEHAGMAGSKLIVSTAERAAHSTGETVLRGRIPAAAGDFAASRGWIKKGGRIQQTLGFQQNVAQRAEAVPAAIQAGFKRSEHHYEQGVADKSTRIQERLGMLGDFDKETIGQVTPKFVHDLAREGKLSSSRVKNIFEHGNRKQKEALLLAFHDGHFDDKPGDDAAKLADKSIARDSLVVDGQKFSGIPPAKMVDEATWKSRIRVKQTGSLDTGEVWGPAIENDGKRFKNRQAYVVRAAYVPPTSSRPTAGSTSGGGTGTGRRAAPIPPIRTSRGSGNTQSSQAGFSPAPATGPGSPPTPAPTPNPAPTPAAPAGGGTGGAAGPIPPPRTPPSPIAPTPTPTPTSGGSTGSGSSNGSPIPEF